MIIGLEALRSSIKGLDNRLRQQPCGDQRWTAVGATSSKKRLDNRYECGIMGIESERDESPLDFATTRPERILGDR